MERFYNCFIALYVHELIRMTDPYYDHEIPGTYDDYYYTGIKLFDLVREHISIGKANYAIKPTDKLIEFGENNLETLIEIGNICLFKDSTIIISRSARIYKNYLNTH